MLDAKSQAKKDRDRLVAEMQKGKDERALLMNEMKRLKSQLSARNTEVGRLTEEKVRLEFKLEQLQPIVLDQQRLVVEIQKEKKESRRWEAHFHEQKEIGEKFQRENSSVLSELRDQLRETKKHNDQLQLDLQKSVHGCKMFEERS